MPRSRSTSATPAINASQDLYIADGLKTGYTVASGFNLVMSAVRDNRRLIGVVMGGPDEKLDDFAKEELKLSRGKVR